MKKVLKWLMIIMLFIIATIMYARFIGTMSLTTKEYTITDELLPSGFDGLKIVHFSDLHYNRAITLDKVKSIVKEINEINPDIVVFTGDLIDKDAILKDIDYEYLSNTLKEINSKYGKYYILGNHDYDSDTDNIINTMNTSGFIHLDNKYDIIYNNKSEYIYISGIDSVSKNKENIETALDFLKDKTTPTYNIFLTHEPDISDKIVKSYSINLILAGHSHGGQVRLPFIGAIYTPEYAKKYHDDYYKIDNTDLYISSGIGVSSFNYRLWNRPSINFYRINKN